MTLPAFGPTFVALLGLAVGSFLNVCIYRVPRGQSLVRPGSRCPSCRAPIRWYDNIPILGYLLLGGRCRQCRARIVATYPLIELATMLLFLAHYWRFGWQPLVVPRLIFACALVVLFVIDLEHRILPNRITLPGILVGLAFSVWFFPGWQSSLTGIVVGSGILLLIAEAYFHLRQEEGLGMGDVKMLAMVGAFLGWRQVLVTLVLSSLVGSLVGLGVIAVRRGSLKYALPYGTFLALAALVSSLFGDALIDWYLTFY